MLSAEGPVQRPKLDENIRILEGLAASGLRSIRYALEVSSYLASAAIGHDDSVCRHGKTVASVI